MNYYQIPQKYTYGNEIKQMALTRQDHQGYTSNVYAYEIRHSNCILNLDYPDQQPPSQMPKRNYRVGDAIKVTTWHCHGKIQLQTNDFVMNPTGQGYQAYANWPWNSQMFMNFRLFAIEMDVDDMFDPIAWFKDVHNYVSYMSDSPSTGEIYPLYTVHEKMLRKTTTYTGRYKVLIDRPFKITSKSTNLDFQIEIPFNRKFEWSEGQITGKPRIPNIYVFIMGPMSSLDVDQESAQRIFTAGDSSYSKPQIVIQMFKKLNFIDL